MSDFKWEMQERIDRGMNPDEAYHATREAYADAADLARKRAKEDVLDSDDREGYSDAERDAGTLFLKTTDASSEPQPEERGESDDAQA